MISSYKNKKNGDSEPQRKDSKREVQLVICRRWAEARWKEVNCHIRGFDSLNCLKPYWLRIMIISVLFWLRVVYQGIFHWGIEELIEYLTAYLHEAVLFIIGSFSVASYYIIQLKNIFYQLFSNFLNFVYIY